MLAFIQKLVDNSLLKFLLVGVLNTIVGYLIFTVIYYLINQTNLSIFIATILGVLFNYKTYSSIVFKSKNNKLILRFILCYTIIMFFQMFLIKIFTFFGFDNIYLISGFITLPMAIVSYFCMKFFVFKKR